MAQPEITFRHGLCSASIYEKEVRQTDTRTVTVQHVEFRRSYLDKEGNWQTTNKLSVNDIPKAILVLNKAYEFMTSNCLGNDTPEEV